MALALHCLSSVQPTQSSSRSGLLHRWLVEYNPLYLFSAALVLGGLTLISRDVAQASALSGSLGIGGLAEVYSLALIGGAAFLVRIGHRRPAAMLGLIAVLFQGDLTLHVETCAYLHLAGKIAAVAWVLVFVAKLYGLAWALELRLSRSAILVPVAGAIGLAAFPQVLHGVDAAARGTLVSLWLFGLAASAVWSERSVACAVELDARGRRCIRATWALWGVLAVAHAVYWSASRGFDLGIAVLAVPLLATRWVRREASVWALVGATLVAAAVAAPSGLWVVAVMAAVALVLSAARARFARIELGVAVPPASPYRSNERPVEPERTVVYDLDPQASARLLVGGAAAAYLAAWTAGWSGGALPEHHVVLDALLVVVCVAAARRQHRPLLAAPLAPMLVHFAAQLGWIPAPQGALGWGVASTGAGFAALLAAILTSWRLGRHLPDRTGPPGQDGSVPASPAPSSP